MNDYEWWHRYRDEDKNACIWFERLDEYEREKCIQKCQKRNRNNFHNIMIIIMALLTVLSVIIFIYRPQLLHNIAFEVFDALFSHVFPEN